MTGALLVILALAVTSYAKKHHYTKGEAIPFYVNNVGPYSNPTETYEYYSLPFCKPKTHVDSDGKLIKKKQRMGEVIQGDRAVLSDYDLPFKEDFEKKVLCEYELKPEEVVKFQNAIK